MLLVIPKLLLLLSVMQMSKITALKTEALKKQLSGDSPALHSSDFLSFLEKPLIQTT